MITRVRDSYRHNFAIIAFGPFLKIIEAVFDLMIPLIMKAVIDLNQYQRAQDIPNIISSRFAYLIEALNASGGSVGNAITGGVIILIMGIAGYVITMCAQYLAARASVNVGTEVRSSLFAKSLQLSKKEREEIGPSKLLTVINSDTYQLQHGVLLFVRLVVRAPFILIGSLIISFILDWRVGLAFLVIVPIILLINFLVLSRSSKQYVSIQEELDHLSNKTSETLEGARVVRASNQQENENKEFQNITTSYQDKSIKVNKLNSLVNPLTFAITSLVLVVIVLLLSGDLFSSLSDDYATTASTIIAEMAYLSQIFFVVVQLSQTAVDLVKANVSKKRIDSVLTIEPSIQSGNKSVKPEEPLIKFNHVSLSFDNSENYFLKDLDFEIRKGETFAIIGGTGSGKSTIINLLERFYDVSDGEILYQGFNLKDYDLNVLRSDLGLVNQKSSLFKGTIKSNYLMSNPNASDQDIVEALKQAEAYEFVSKYEDDINHEVKESASNFSGGQKQRLCIGRALVRKPKVLILDDATSALDLLTDKKIRETISSLKDMTKIIVSQRVATVQNADYILVLDGGKVVGRGKHEELLVNSPIYQEIYETQIKKEQ